MAVRDFDMAATTVALTTSCVLRRDSAGGDRTAPLGENANCIGRQQRYPPVPCKTIARQTKCLNSGLLSREDLETRDWLAA